MLEATLGLVNVEKATAWKFFLFKTTRKKITRNMKVLKCLLTKKKR